MVELANISFDKLLKLYQTLFSLGYINSKFENKIALISMVCYVTNAVRKKNPDITCYDVLLKIAKDFGEVNSNTFLKSLAVVCEDMMYGCSDFPTFGVEPKEMPAQIKKILGDYCPF